MLPMHFLERSEKVDCVQVGLTRMECVDKPTKRVESTDYHISK